MEPKLASTLRSSCLSLQITETAGMSYHAYKVKEQNTKSPNLIYTFIYNINYINIYINSTQKARNKNKHKRINYFTKSRNY